MPGDFGQVLKLKWADMKTRKRGDLTAVGWKEK
jgi:hypothetical protein